MIKNGVVFFVEGETEVEFYKKLIKYLHDKYGNFQVDKVQVENLKGIGNYKNRVIRIFDKRILQKYSGYTFVVVLCYDTDVFEYEECPQINWKEIELELKKSGAKTVIHVKAKKSIEDWFLEDEANLKKFLNISKNTKIKGQSGQEKIKDLFRKANKTYVKGQKCEGLIDALDMEKILTDIPEELNKVYKILGIK